MNIGASSFPYRKTIPLIYDILSFFQDLTAKEAKAQWQPFFAWLEKYPDDFKITTQFDEIPPQKFWDYEYLNQHFPGFVVQNTMAGASKGEYWYKVTAAEVSTYIYSWLSRMLPQTLFEDANAKSLAHALFTASRLAHIDLHFYKGLAGSTPAVLNQTKETSLSPGYSQTEGLALIAQYSPEGTGYDPQDLTAAKKAADRMGQAIHILRAIAPQSGAYLNEADYFEPNWQTAFWGSNYTKLLEIKKRYDPKGLFYCHHCVGSESWTADGMCLKE